MLIVAAIIIPGGAGKATGDNPLVEILAPALWILTFSLYVLCGSPFLFLALPLNSLVFGAIIGTPICFVKWKQRRGPAADPTRTLKIRA